MSHLARNNFSTQLVDGLRLNQKMKKSDPAVFALSRSSRCYGCDRKLEAGEIIDVKNKETDKEVFCLKCAGLGDLEILLSGNQKITRLASKYSTRRFVIMKWSDTWKCYERQGILVEAQAIDKAEAESGEKLKARTTGKTSLF